VQSNFALKEALIVPLLVALLLAVPSERLPALVTLCSTSGESTARTEHSIRDLVQAAEVVVHARAMEQRRPPGLRGFPPVEVRFEVLEVLHGTLPEQPLWIRGALVDQDDFNTGPVPYMQVRSDGTRGSCFAYFYRGGGEFLLLLRRDEIGALSPYWSVFAPTNEQVRGAEDPWVRWVRQVT
jgi:hypothetical protein